MIHVVATITLQEGAREDFLDIFKANVHDVLAEDGCIAYEPTVDIETDIPVHAAPRDNVVTIMEQWESLDHLMAHLAQPHMKAYKQKTEAMVKGVSLQVVTPV